jgi:hypothetical protein
MKGRGLLIAAAVIQLVGASVAILSGLEMLFLLPALAPTLSPAPAPAAAAASAMAAMRVVGIIELIMAGVAIWVSVKLIQRRRWAWVTSLVLSSLGGLFLLVGMVGMLGFGVMRGHQGGMALGFGELIIMLIVGTPIYVVIGLLIGGRAAISDAAAPRA